MFFRSISGFDNFLSLQILLVLSPLVILWAMLDTMLIFLLRRRYTPPIFILLYRPHLSENRKRSILRWLFILSILIGHVLAVSFNATIEFNAGFFLLAGMAGVGQSLTLYFSSKFDYDENQIEEKDRVL